MCSAVASVARANDLPIPFFANLIWQESGFDPRIISPAGAQGVAQFMPQTAKEYGLINPFEPIHALHAAGKFLRKLQAQFGNLGLAAAAYNAGPRRVSDWMAKRGGLPDETRNYVIRITGRAAEQVDVERIRARSRADFDAGEGAVRRGGRGGRGAGQDRPRVKLMSKLAAATRAPPPTTLNDQVRRGGVDDRKHEAGVAAPRPRRRPWRAQEHQRAEGA